MPVVDRVIAPFPPHDGREWEEQCARCGSSCHYVDCWECGGEGAAGHDCGDDTCCCLHPDDNVRCDTCHGHGGWYECLSGADWCEAHPHRNDVPRGRIEWFTFDARPAQADRKDGA